MINSLTKHRFVALRFELFLAIAAVACYGWAADAAEEDLKSAATAFVELLATAQYEKATENFDATMTRVFPVDKVAETWAAVVGAAGAFRGRGGTRSEKIGVYRAVFVTCRFEKADLEAKVVFDRQQKIAGLFFAQPRPEVTYKPPAYTDRAKFHEIQVTIGAEPWRLPGTLTIPEGTGSFSTVILVHGSGPNDRDETIFSNKPFKDLAWGLASQGIAVLRYDKRTYVHPEKLAQITALTVKEEVLDDVFAALAFLKQQSHVDSRHIYVAGHSLGGYLVPRISARDQAGAIAGFVVLAGSTRPTEDLVLEQTNYIASLDGSVSDQEKEQLDQIEQLVKQIKDTEVLSRSSGPILGAPAAYWLDLHHYRPPQIAAQTKHPMLILQGERDYQVTMEDFAGWQQGLAPRANIRFKTYPNLNHLFVAGEGRSTPSEYELGGNVAKQVIDDIAGWIGERP